MKKPLLLTWILLVAMAPVAIAQGPDGLNSLDDGPKLRLSPELVESLDPERAKSLQRLLDRAERVRNNKTVKAVPVDVLEARNALYEMIDNADDREIVAFFHAVREAKVKRDHLQARLSSLKGQIEAMREASRTSRPRQEH